MAVQADTGADGTLTLTGARLAGMLALQAQVQTLVLTGFPTQPLFGAVQSDGKGTPASDPHAQTDGHLREAAVR